jgi:hypothetical protein
LGFYILFCLFYFFSKKSSKNKTKQTNP